MELVIGIIAVTLIILNGLLSFNKIQREDKVAYERTVEDTSFNTPREKRA